MKNALLIIQIIVTISLIIVIIMQSRGGGLSTAFGGSGQIYRSRRGIEKMFVYMTIILATVFFIISVLQLLI